MRYLALLEAMIYSPLWTTCHNCSDGIYIKGAWYLPLVIVAMVGKMVVMVFMVIAFLDRRLVSDDPVK